LKDHLDNKIADHNGGYVRIARSFVIQFAFGDQG